jgi:Tetratricopeptide repeat
MKRSRLTWPRRSLRRPRLVRRSSLAAGLVLWLGLTTAAAVRRLGNRRSPVEYFIPPPVRRAGETGGAPDGATGQEYPSAAEAEATPGSGPPRHDDDPVHVVYDHFCAGMDLLETGNPAQAAVRLEKARAGAPNKASIREGLGRAYFDLARLSDAEAEFRAVVEIAPTNDYAHFCLARVLERRGRFDEAALHRKLAQAMSPDEERYRRPTDV